MVKISGAVLIAAIILIMPLAVYAQPLPHGISGIVYMSDAETEASRGTNFSVNDTTSGYYIEGTTGAGHHSGWYSVSINGSDGDTVLIKAGNETHYGERTVTLVQDMTGINVFLRNLSIEQQHATASCSGTGSTDGAALPVVTPTATPVSTISTPKATSGLTPISTIAPTMPLSSPTPESKKNLPGFKIYFAFFVLIVSYLLKKKGY
ncbi:hypothetical protein C5S31_04735 [ANME-1 cluster archaeon GoMg2]|nr:hypothetical protein [ANME-1 cluster archaeon GoMg2]